MNINVVIAIIFIIIVVIIPIIINETKMIITIWILCIIGYVLSLYNDISNIPAIDVYRGNTELEIIYKNNTPIDSIVIWKNK